MSKSQAKKKKKRTLLSLLIRGFLFIALVDLLVIALVAGIGWWAGWTELDHFKNAIQIAGLGVIALGLLGIKGNQDFARDFESGTKTASAESGWERTQQRLFGLAQRYSFLVIMLIAGGVCLLIGWLM